MMPVAVRTTQTSAEEGRLKVAAGGKSSKVAKKKKLMAILKDHSANC